MAEPLSLTASVVGVVSFGMRLATALQTYTELASEANEALHDIVFDINATASALKQLSELIEADKLAASKQGRLPIFKDAGETEIRNIATQLEKVYKAIVVLVKKATSFKTEASSSQNSSSDGMVIDPSQLKPLNFFRKAKWPWMVPRVERYQAQLHWLKFSLLINLQLADLAQINMSTGPRADGAFDQELAARGAAEKLRGRQVALGRKMAVKQKKKKRARPGNTTRGVEPVIRVDAENVSISSSDDASPGPSPTLKPASHSPQAHSTSAVTTKPEVSGTFVQVTPKEQHANEQRGTSPAGEQQEEKSTTNNNTNTNVETPKPNQEPPPQDTPDEDPSVETPPPTNRKTPTRFLLPSFLHSFTFPIFGATDKYLSDTPSEDLEAYIISSDSPSTPTKLPFGHRRLTFGLKRTLKAKRGSTWYRYVTNSTPTQRHLIDQVTKYAQGQSNHMRTCVSIQEFKPDGKLPYYLVFYSLCEPPPPLYFTDCIDRHYRLPFEQYKIWENMKALIETSFYDHTALNIPVGNGHYHLFTAGEEIVIPKLWASTLRPGDKITMKMKPIEPLRRPGMLGMPGMSGRPGIPGRSSGPPPPPTHGGSAWLGPDIIEVSPIRPPKGSTTVLGWMAGSRARYGASSSASSESSPSERDSSDEEREDEDGEEEETEEDPIIDFTKESQKEGVSDLLRRFTNVSDVSSSWKTF